jgi:hypothetical protein
MTWFDATAATLIRAAVKGNPEAAREIWARTGRSAPRLIEITVDCHRGQSKKAF